MVTNKFQAQVKKSKKTQHTIQKNTRDGNGNLLSYQPATVYEDNKNYC